MSDLLREVDDELRAEKLRAFWNEHKSALVAGVIALILGTAAMTFWNNYQLRQNEKQTGAILAAFDASDPASALFNTAAASKGNAQIIAYLNAASLELKSGDKQKALNAYIKASGSKSADAALRDLAVLQKTNLSLDLKPDAKAEDMLKDLKSVSDNKKSPWAGEAIFMTAFLKAEKNKDYTSAVTDLKNLQTRDDVTESIKSRAAALQSVYELKQEKKS